MLNYEDDNMNIVFITTNKFPNGDAGAIREYMFGKMLNLSGHNVFFIGMGVSDNFETMNYNGYKYTTLRLNYSNIIGKLRNYFGYSRRLKKYLKCYSASSKIDVLWIVGLPLNALLMLKSYAKKQNIKLVHDSVEWYSPEQFKLGKLNPNYLLKELNNRYLINKDFKVVAISKYLESHFNGRGIKTIRIPIVFDKDEILYTKNITQDKLTILYAGTPGKKDYLSVMLCGLALLNYEQLEQIEFRIIGVSKEELCNMFENNKNVLAKVKNNLNVIGKVPREEVIKNLSQSDFTVLLRSAEQRYAKAGFPTKVVESLATGTPVILNITSDLADYIIDGVNGLIVDECTPESFRVAINRALNQNYIERKLMQDNARRTFEECFDYKLYVDILEEIII